MNNGLTNTNLNEFNSIIEAIPDSMRLQYTGYPIRDELLIWWKLKYDKLIEVEDLDRFKMFTRKVLKLFIYSNLSAIISIKILDLFFVNRFTKLVRVLIRSSIATAYLYHFFLLSFFDNFSAIHRYFTIKYSYRFKQYNEIGDPLLMNRFYFSHHSFNNDEKDSRKLLYDKIKFQQTALIKSLNPDKKI